MTNYKTEWLRDNGKRYLAWLALAIAFAVACWFLSQWQVSRLNEVKAANALITTNYGQAPAKLQDLVTPTTFDQKNEYRSVEITGYYAQSGAVLVRNRPQDGQPGFVMFVPFLTNRGQLVYIDRGWYPTGSKQDLPDNVQQLPTSCNPITVIGHLRTSEPNSKRHYPVGQIGNISPEEASANSTIQTDGTCSQPSEIIRSAYLTLESETPALKTPNAPKAIQKPELSEGNHLSYAMQWVLFAIMAFIALFYMIRQELLLKKEQTDKSFKRKVRKKVGQADEDYEDQLTQRD